MPKMRWIAGWLGRRQEGWMDRRLEWKVGGWDACQSRLMWNFNAWECFNMTLMLGRRGWGGCFLITRETRTATKREGQKRRSANRMTQNDKQEWKKLYIYSIQLVRVYILYAIYIYIWRFITQLSGSVWWWSANKKMQNNMERAGKSVCWV